MTPFDEPESESSRGMSLGWRLGLTATLIVVVVLGGTSTWQQIRETRRWREDRRELLAESLAPLVAEVESATNLDAARVKLEAFEQSYARVHHPRNRVDLVDSRGWIVASSHDGPPITPGDRILSASAVVNTAILSGGHGKLVLQQDSSLFEEAVANAWRLAALSFGLTVLCLIAGLLLANHFLISRPLARLLETLDQLERGYWNDQRGSPRVWEFRFLAYRFRRLGARLDETVSRLLSAERRSLGNDVVGAPRVETAVGRPPHATTQPRGAPPLQVRQRLERMCRLLDTPDPADPATIRLAQAAWTAGAAEADRIGDHQLKNRLEDAALQVLEPQAYDELRRYLEAFTATHRSWIQAQEDLLLDVLDLHGVEVLSVQHRIKQVASLWRKTRAKRLAPDQVQDIVAFRIIVPECDDCYAALKAIHRHFQTQPLRFKDYIAHPKSNGYQSLHTAIQGVNGPVFEVQIRSADMHAGAESGTAAHWRYAESQSAVAGFTTNEAPLWRRMVSGLRRTGSPGPINR